MSNLKFRWMKGKDGKKRDHIRTNIIRFQIISTLQKEKYDFFKIKKSCQAHVWKSRRQCTTQQSILHGAGVARFWGAQSRWCVLTWMTRAIAGVRAGRADPEMNSSARQSGGVTTNAAADKSWPPTERAISECRKHTSTNPMLKNNQMPRDTRRIRANARALKFLAALALFWLLCALYGIGRTVRGNLRIISPRATTQMQLLQNSTARGPTAIDVEHNGQFKSDCLR